MVYHTMPEIQTDIRRPSPYRTPVVDILQVPKQYRAKHRPFRLPKVNKTRITTTMTFDPFTYGLVHTEIPHEYGDEVRVWRVVVDLRRVGQSCDAPPFPALERNKPAELHPLRDGPGQTIHNADGIKYGIGKSRVNSDRHRNSRPTRLVCKTVRGNHVYTTSTYMYRTSEIRFSMTINVSHRICSS